jgi:hypothetical protein
MPSISPRRTLLALTLTAFLALPSLALAAPRYPASAAAPEAHAGQGVFTQLWSFLQHLWGAEGMSIDPNGRATAAPAPRSLTHVSGAAGMLIDPDGSHATATPAPTPVSGDSGMSIDPDGRH